MKTSDLVRALAADCAAAPLSLRQLFGIAMIPGVAIALSLYFVNLGPRLHLLALFAEPRFLFKVCLSLLLAVLSATMGLAPRLSRAPTAAAPPSCWRSFRPCWGRAIAAELLSVPVGLWGQRMIGTNALLCLKTIPYLGLAPLAAVLWCLRQGAPEHPARAGAAAGLLAGAIGAALYATHCPDDSPLFVAVWYSLAICFLTALGAVAGSRLLRW